MEHGLTRESETVTLCTTPSCCKHLLGYHGRLGLLEEGFLACEEQLVNELVIQ